MRTIISLLSLVLSISLFANETWEIRLVLDVPRVFNNTGSLGYRQYQKQRFKGFFDVSHDGLNEPTVTFCRLENLDHQVNGKNVTYDVTVEDEVHWHGIGSNRTGVFDTRSVALTLVAEPSYSIGHQPTDDNTLVITLSGKGNDGYLQGFAAGNLGCGCHDYGHVSPTRIWGTSTVVDTAGVYGKFKAKLIGR